MTPAIAYTKPNWKPLEGAMAQASLDVSTCGSWMWMSHGADGAESYKHVCTRRYVWIDRAGNVYHGTGLQLAGPYLRQMLETGEVAA
jgi:hypothetical protein